jgi:hypothetical protein
MAALAGALSGACGGAPEPRASAPRLAQSVLEDSTRAPLRDECQAQPGEPPPKALERSYTGVAKRARCQAELYSIMTDVSDSLGVSCSYCHLVPDFRAMTQRKQIANWMASELVPALHKKGTERVPWCSDCHRVAGRGRAKFLGDPRDTSFASEWMTIHLVENFETKSGSFLRCNSCHHGNLGTPQFQHKIILTGPLSGG